MTLNGSTTHHYAIGLGRVVMYVISIVLLVFLFVTLKRTIFRARKQLLFRLCIAVHVLHEMVEN